MRNSAGMKFTSGNAQRFIIETERLSLKKLVPADANPRYVNWLADPEIMGALNARPVRVTMVALAQHIGKMEDGRRVEVGIFLKSPADHIGNLMLDFIPQHKSAKLSFFIGEKRLWGQGYLTEAASGLITYLFEKRGMERVVAQVATENAASIAALRKLGFVEEGKLRGEIISIKDNCRRDQYFFGLLKSDQSKNGNSGQRG
jgi:ribosomal-protein-alanine N-acetyltransferase